MKRFLVMAVVLAAAMMEYRYIHPIGTVLGMFGVKISAFMQPKIHRIMTSQNRQKKADESKAHRQNVSGDVQG